MTETERAIKHFSREFEKYKRRIEDCPVEWPAQKRTLITLCGYHKTALSALRLQAERETTKPLTPEELREREQCGQGIYVYHIDGAPIFPEKQYTAAVLDRTAAFGDMGYHLQAIYGRGLTLAEDDYGLTWIAYDHPIKEDKPEKGRDSVRKWEAIKAISEKSSRYGDKLLELMDRYGAFNLQEITAAQAEAFLEELHQGAGICPGECVRNYADPAPHCPGCTFNLKGDANNGE